MVDATQVPYRVKGTNFRAYVKYLRDNKKFELVQRALPPHHAAVLATPPLPGSWVDANILQDIVAAVFDIEGEAAALEMARQVIREVAPGYLGAIQAILRVLGTSPSRIFARLNDLLKQTLQGQDYRFTSTSARAGTIDLHIAATRPVPHSAWVAPVALFEFVFSLCNVKGTISEPRVTGLRSARFTLTW